jgi:hypothetical protein
MKPILKPIGALLFLAAGQTFTPSSQAALTAYAVNGIKLVYDDDFGEDGLTWTQDANLFKTMAVASGDAATFVATVIESVGGKIHDAQNRENGEIYHSYHTLSADDFNPANGKMSWWGAQAWMGYLNAIHYGGANDWRLPSTTYTGSAICNIGYNGTDCGYNVAAHSSELAHLFFSELGNTSMYTTAGIYKQDRTISDWGTTNTGPFENLRNFVYWSGTEFAPDPSAAWSFATYLGYQRYGAKNLQFYAWAVRAGLCCGMPVRSSR